MFGHQDDTFYGLTWKWQSGRSDTRETCGELPAVMGFELGGIELGGKVNLDSVPFALMRQEILQQAARGGIVTISWHPRNPLTGGDAWDTSSAEVVRSVLPGGKCHDTSPSLDDADDFRQLHDDPAMLFIGDISTCIPSTTFHQSN